MDSFSIEDARQQFDMLLDQLRREPEQPIIVKTDNGEPVIVMLTWTLYESLVETLDIYSHEGLISDIRRGIQELEEGRTLSTEEAWRQLGW